MAVPQWRRASRKPPGNGVLPKDDSAKGNALKDGCLRTRSTGTVARRHGVIRFGGAFLLTGRRPLYFRLPAWRWLCAAEAASRRLPIQPFHRSQSTADTFWRLAERTLGRQRPHYRECLEPGPIAPARRPGPIMKTPRATEGRVPGSAWMRPWDVRARDWRDCKHDEPVLACDCDLRFSFP